VTVTLEQYRSDVENQWCPGCGNFGILEAVKKVLVGLNLPPEQVVICTGIGQAPKLPHYMRVNTFNGLHGREVASATAIKLAAPELTVLVHAGDGGAYGEGGNHLLHAIRRNIDLTVVVHDNKVYGLTKGQASPTTEEKTPMKIQPQGVQASPLNPLALAISQSCSFVAQGMSARKDELVSLLTQAIQHKGFSLLNVLQPCVTWDKVHTYAYYQDRCAPIGPEHDPEDPLAAMRLVIGPNDRIPVGVIFRNDRLEYCEQTRRDRPSSRRCEVDPFVVNQFLEEMK
jgi:2-oxoglutarate/2-oxoacid ferredoxin oxidoreductase subunit beta